MRCPVCHNETSRSFVVRTQEAAARRRCVVFACACGVQFMKDHAEDRSWVYGDDYAAWGSSAEDGVETSKKDAFRMQLARLAPHVRPHGKRLLDIGTGKGYLLEAAREMGFECWGVEPSAPAAAEAARRHPGRIFQGLLEDAGHAAGSFDVITLTDVIEHVSDPGALLAQVARLLVPGGLVLIITPDISSFSRRLLGGRWFQYKYEHVVYFERRSLRRLLDAAGFDVVALEHNKKRFRLSYYASYFRKYSFLYPLDRLFLLIYAVLPRAVREMGFTNAVTGEMLAVGRKR